MEENTKNKEPLITTQKPDKINNWNPERSNENETNKLND